MASSSSFKSNHHRIYDVFINFSGTDTRRSFVLHLYSALKNVGVEAFMDDEKLERGKELKPELLRAIGGSRISLVVLSRNFAASKGCLDALVKIMECQKAYGQVVIPIFCDVDPLDVRNQRGAFAMEATEEDVLLRRKTALTQVGNLSGWDLRERDEDQLVKSIVQDVLNRIESKLPITEFPVGLDAKVGEVIGFIRNQSSKVCMVGISGMGGSGKTTTAKAIYNQIYSLFEGTSFIENIREVCQSDETKGYIHLQEQLLSDVLKKTKEKIYSIAKGISMINQSLSGKKALLILDDVTTSDQLKVLCGNREWFGSGTVIIVTTRDESLLNLLEADHICRMQEMDKDKALELFSLHAFGEASPREDLIELSINIVTYCRGLPLALEVLGSYLYERTKQDWKSVLSKLERTPNDQVQHKLRISYDGLKDEMEKDIFLDICCFFIGKDRACVTEILNGCGLYADIGITILIKRSLLKVDKNNKMGMHDLIQDMGREVVRESSRNEPEKRSRLWNHHDVHDVLTENTGTETVEGLVFKHQRRSRGFVNASAFKKMNKLRLLQLDNVELTGDYGYLSKELRWVYWRECAFNYMPKDFYQGNLVVLELKHSRIIQVWEEAMLMKKLKILNLSHSRYLESTPDFSKLPNLEKLIMKDCPNLREVHRSIGDLRKIHLINLKDCKSLRILPRVMYKLKSLKTLIISGIAAHSSSSNHKWIYDVFISFRGEDCRKSFISHLCAALSNAGVNAFLDDQELKRGEEIAPSLLRAIEGSRISLVVLSKNYASSSWCLDELLKIMECYKTYGQVVIPIFYKVDPSHVRHLMGHFSLEAIGSKGYTEEKLLSWKAALNEVGNLSGYHLSNHRGEAEEINAIVKDVLIKLDIRLMSITDFPVGLVSRMQEVVMLIESQLRKVYMVGIWGMGGLGKTTTAKAIFNQIHRKFEDKSFIENIREVCESDSARGHIHLQEQLLSDVLKTKEKIHGIGSGTAMIQKILSQKRALVILDDVSTSEQLKALCGNREWFGPGSVLIVTTRDIRLLNSLKADYVYRMKEMDEDESLELFSWHAFKEASPRKDFSELSRSVVAYCGGLPLALEVLGSYLYLREQHEWRSVLSKLEKIPNDQVQQKLRISYDGLKDETEKNIFLDICCFFIGKDKAYVTEILNGCELEADIGITVLKERSLLQVEKNNKLVMHDLVRDMGREIVRESSKKEPGNRSRLWFPKDGRDVLTNNTGTKTVEGLVFKSERSRVCFNANAFKKMKKLRLLQLDNVELEGDYGYLSKELTWVYWRECAVKYIPRDFYQGSLVVLELKHNRIVQVWEEAKLMEKLKILNLSHSRCLKNTPDFSKLPNLEKLIMKDCPSLREVHESIGDLSNILLINLEDCTSLSNLPRKFYKLKSLETLIISGCSKIDRLEEDIEQMESLTRLIAEDTAVKEVPRSIVRLKSLLYISLCGYEGLTRDVFPSLIWSWMPLTTLPRITQFGGMPMPLVSMDIQNDNSGYLSRLRRPWIQCHLETQLTRKLRRSPDDLYDVNFSALVTTSHASQVSDCFLKSVSIEMGSSHLVIDALRKRIEQGLASSGSYNILLPGDNYPSWLTYKGEGPSVKFEVPYDSDCCMKGITLCVVYSSTRENTASESLTSVSIFNSTKDTTYELERDRIMSFNDEDWQGVISSLGPCDNVQISVAFGRGFSVKETAVYLIYGESINMEDKPSIKVKLEPPPQVNIRSYPNVEMEPSSEVNVHPSANVEMEPSHEINVHSSTNLEMEPSLEINVQPSPNVEMKPSPEIYVHPSDNPTSDTLASTSAPSASVGSSSIQLTLDRFDSMQIHFDHRLDSFQASVNDRFTENNATFTELNSRMDSLHDMMKKMCDYMVKEINVQQSPNVEMEASPKVNVLPSANVEMEPSPEVNVQPVPELDVLPSPTMEFEPSPKVNMLISDNVKMESSPKPKKNIFARMGELLCLSQNRGLDMP